MNLRHLEYLLAVADTGSFSRAAERCHITQSALSRSIQTLEDDLGARLIDRMGKRNELTPFGQTVASRARRMVLDAVELKRSAQLLQEGYLGVIRIGLGAGPTALLMQPFLRYMASMHPRVQVSLESGPPELQTNRLRERGFDALVVDLRSVTPADDLLIEDLGQMRGGFICRAGHPLAKLNTPITFAHLQRYPLASTSLNPELARLLITRYGPAADPQVAVTLRCNDVSSLLHAVHGSDAVFLGLVSPAREAIANGSLVELPITPALNEGAHFAFVTLADRTEAPAMGIFRQFVAEHLHD